MKNKICCTLFGGIMISLIVGLMFTFSKENAIDTLIGDRIIQILMTSLALYFAVTGSALNSLKELSKIAADIKKAANENRNLDEKTRRFFIEKADELEASSECTAELIHKYLVGMIVVVLVVIAFACLKNVILSFEIFEWATTPLLFVNNSLYLFSLLYTLYIIYDTSKFIFFMHKRY